eukprot:CAMPEP_0170484162 /NCGR_PEP_ID=MMETSP0208-20121228/3693_1 /TAXON_ID=197538 /ORGANISM="Strombidium inclinatum, Strain S3" /LENGTH=129 /DNA_ID=CAMNT_0010757435 /DNA_START=3138 /DNA_END=3527 /DNA_ORIENTATION=+
MAEEEEGQDEVEESFEAGGDVQELLDLFKNTTLGLFEQFHDSDEPGELGEPVHPAELGDTDDLAVRAHDHVEGDHSEQVDQEPGAEVSYGDLLSMVDKAEVLVVECRIEGNNNIGNKDGVDRLVDDHPY